MKDYQQMEWQSNCIEKTRTYNDILAIKDEVDSLEFQYNYFESLKYLRAFDNLRSLIILNNSLNDLSELKQFPKLESLTLRNTQIDTLDKMPAFASLRELDLSGNNIVDLYPIARLRNVEVLDISGENNRPKAYSPLLALKKLKKLTIGSITSEGLDSLQKTFPNVKIVANVVNTYEGR